MGTQRTTWVLPWCQAWEVEIERCPEETGLKIGNTLTMLTEELWANGHDGAQKSHYGDL